MTHIYNLNVMTILYRVSTAMYTCIQYLSYINQNYYCSLTPYLLVNYEFHPYSSSNETHK